MKRDFDLIRRIMLEAEKVPAGETLARLTFPEYDQQTINQHIALLIEASLLEGNPSTGARLVPITGITWAGHDFLDAMKDETIWAKVKAEVLKPVGGVTVGVLLEYLRFQLRQKLGIPTGSD